MDASLKLSKNGDISWPEALSFKQNFILPDSIMYYVTKNPSTPKCYLKMAQSCKYFFEKNPILIVARNDDYGIKRFCAQNYIEFCCINQKCCTSFDVFKITSKVWLTYQLTFLSSVPLAAFAILPKIYQCDALLRLLFTKITLDEFTTFASVFQKFSLMYVHITDNHGHPVMLEEILESIQNVKEFYFDFDDKVPTATAFTMKNILKLKNLGSLCRFTLDRIPEIFDVKDLSDFISHHRNATIRLFFINNISEKYKIQLDSLVDTVINAQIPQGMICYDGIDDKKYNIMNSR